MELVLVCEVSIVARVVFPSSLSFPVSKILAFLNLLPPIAIYITYVPMVAQKPFQITLSRILLSLLSILLLYHLSLLLLHSFVTKVEPVVPSNDKA